MCHANRGLLASPFELSSSREVEWGSEVGLEPSAIMGPDAFVEGSRPIIPGPRRLGVDRARDAGMLVDELSQVNVGLQARID
ncbi:hypothetical protein BHM03_00026787 [Ensete ventricosum]|nr:hypothetical protein BHM03_00026787 [Ensete ventricosum]